ncbi:MAG: hypothetical protein ACR2PR_05040 [Pseudohongiellaceae bacterium]
MSAKDEYIDIFGKINSLAEDVPWPSGISNMLEWLAWEPHNILGISKSKYQEKVVDCCLDAIENDVDISDIKQKIKKHFKDEGRKNLSKEKYADVKKSIATSREALRRAKFFSEKYLNKEFDIFISLSSDRYIDDLYSQTFEDTDVDIMGGGHWFAHGDGGLFWNSTKTDGNLAIDNVCYSEHESLLVANELKLRGDKNKDQILKYSLLLKLLREEGFVDINTSLVLLFISNKKENIKTAELVENEINFCKKKNKERLIAEDIINIAQGMIIECLTWKELIIFNESYIEKLSEHQQVERKLLQGFNETLKSKECMNN